MAVKKNSTTKAVTKSYIRTFIAAILAVVSFQLQTNGGDLGSLLSIEFAFGALGAGVLAVLGPLARWLDTSDTAFGKVAEPPAKKKSAK